MNLKGKWGFIDKTGKEIIPLKYEDVGKFKEGLAAVKLTGKWGFIDKSGAQIIPLQFEEVKYFYNGMSGAKLNNLWGIIDKSGNEIVPFKYVAVSYFDKNEYVQVKINNDTWKFLDMNGKLYDTNSKIVENYTFNNSYSDYKNFKSYSGEMLFRPVYIPLPNGRGKITYIDGSTYEGYISMGNPQGTNGKMILAPIKILNNLFLSILFTKFSFTFISFLTIFLGNFFPELILNILVRFDMFAFFRSNPVSILLFSKLFLKFKVFDSESFKFYFS